MRNGTTILLTVGVVVWFSGVARGQPGGALGNRFRDPATLVQNEGVRKELRLTDEQKNKVSTLPSEIRLRLFPEHEKLKEIKDPKEREKRRQELMAKAAQTGADDLAKILTAAQMKRLKQIALQQGDVYVFSEPGVVKALDLTTAQQQQITTITAEGTAKLRELRSKWEDNASLEVMRDRTAPLRKKAVDQAVAILSADQKQIWKEMTGEPFDFKAARPSKAFEAPAQPIESIGAKFAKDDLSWVEKRVRDLEPTKAERGFDQIGWFRDLREAVQVSKDRNRPVFVITHNGSLSAGRC
jgi:hypothetical protein